MKVLIADDEKELAKALQALLKHNNYSVDCVYDGQEALNYVEVGNYDALILDVMMPKLDGYSVLKKMRERDNHTPVLMLTAKGEIDDLVRGLDLGADDYLPKPFEAKELLARLRVIIRRSHSTSSNALSFKDLNLDISMYKLSVGDKSVKLSNKEFQIMELLMMKPGTLISTESLMSKVWTYDSDSEINVVWVYISALRKKLALLTPNIVIKSNRGTGYSLECTND